MFSELFLIFLTPPIIRPNVS